MQRASVTSDSTTFAINQIFQVSASPSAPLAEQANGKLTEFTMEICCSDPAVHALQFLDVINMKDPTQKAHFYRNTLREVLPFVPRVN